MIVGILGSGFGLYGYLPAAAACSGVRILLPGRYRPKLDSRPELAEFSARVDWAADDADVLSRATALIVSRRPADQVELVRHATACPNLTHLLLEKPLAPEPEAAAGLLDDVDRAGKRLRIGFTFRLTPWAHDLKAWLAGSGCDSLAIEWRFRAHHYSHGVATWKRRHPEGGGALRFYGIHLIALLAELGYATVSESHVRARLRDEAESWTATLAGPGLPPCRILVDSDSPTASFEVLGRATGLRPLDISCRDPFDLVPALPGQDRRATLLAELCRSLLGLSVPSGPGVSTDPAPWYRASVDLWRAAERALPAGATAQLADVPTPEPTNR